MWSLSHSRRGARTMGAILVGSGVVALAALRLIEFVASEGGRAVDDLALNVAAELVLLPLVGGIAVLLAAGVIRSLSPAHYGKPGAIRWALVGFGFGIWWGLAGRALPPLEPAVLDRLLRGGLQVGGLLWLYWLAFHILPPLDAPPPPD